MNLSPPYAPPVMPPNIGRDNVVTRDGQSVVLRWSEMTPAERAEIVMANVNRCPPVRR
jgi:hypothetical protein